MIALRKALGTGRAGSSLLAREELRAAARTIAYPSTYVFETPPIAAAIAFLEIDSRGQTSDRMVAAGKDFRSAAHELLARGIFKRVRGIEEGEDLVSCANRPSGRNSRSGPVAPSLIHVISIR